jgi:hypothetical protein
MTPQEKVDELVENLGVFNAIYLAEHVLIVLEDYAEVENNINEWKEVLELLEKRQ